MTTESKTGGVLQIVEPTEVRARMENGQTFIVNVVTAWCPDCTERQSQHIESFAQRLHKKDLDVLQVEVQLTKGEFISAEHEALTDLFGGHGYPRTVLIKNGEITDSDNVEVLTHEALSELATRFIESVEAQ